MQPQLTYLIAHDRVADLTRVAERSRVGGSATRARSRRRGFLAFVSFVLPHM